jgi:hypothetical protein
VTLWDPNPDKPARPRRPLLVELASAFLIVNGLLSTSASANIVMKMGETPGVGDPGILLLITLAIGISTIVLGILIRFARAWIVALNVAAVAGFLELTAGSQAGMIVGLLDVFVVLALLMTRPWFIWTPNLAPNTADDEAS